MFRQHNGKKNNNNKLMRKRGVQRKDNVFSQEESKRKHAGPKRLSNVTLQCNIKQPLGNDR